MTKLLLKNSTWEYLRLFEDKRDGIPIIHCDGEIDAFTSPQLESLCRSKSEEGEKSIIINLSKIEYLDASALSVLIKMIKLFQEDGKIQIVIPETSYQIHRIIKIAQLGELIPSSSSVEEAIDLSLASQE